MKLKDLTVRCMVNQEGRVWVAVCIDLCLAVQADSREEAKERLHEQIVLYVREALTVDADKAEQLLSRKAPLVDRLRYAFWHVVANRPRIRRNLRRLVQSFGVAARRTIAYRDPLPFQPA